ncbi:hypothetical protein COBT_003746, partial [Conglomerata obtusa]
LNFPLSKAIICLYLYCPNYSYKNIAGEIMIHRNYIFKFIRKVISVSVYIDRNSLYGKLGNNLPETIIETDEMHIVTRRDG